MYLKKILERYFKDAWKISSKGHLKGILIKHLEKILKTLGKDT